MFPKLEQGGWQIAQAVRQIWDGRRDPGELTAGLDDNGARVVHRILELIEPPPAVESP